MKMLRIITISILSVLISVNSYADTDGSIELSNKNQNTETKDCFEKINRGVFAFNQVVNDVVFEPLAKGYRKLPSPVRTGTSNALSNLSIMLTLPNNILQGDILIAGKNSLRFILNTTLGVLGIFDPASKVGLNEYQSEDFGQTLGRWGMGEGCYIVLPVLGPSTLRDTTGSIGTKGVKYSLMVKRFSYCAGSGTPLSDVSIIFPSCKLSNFVSSSSKVNAPPHILLFVRL